MYKLRFFSIYISRNVAYLIRIDKSRLREDEKKEKIVIHVESDHFGQKRQKSLFK